MDTINGQNMIHVPHHIPLMQNQTSVYTAFGPESQTHNCHHCGTQVKTEVKNKASTKTHCWFLCCCVFLCWLCAPCVYCMKSCTVQEHYCPNCKNYLGMHNRN